MNPSCVRVATLGSSDVTIALEHIRSHTSKKKVNLLCDPSAVLMNIEWLRLLLQALNKLKDMAIAYRQSRDDLNKTSVFRNNLLESCLVKNIPLFVT